MTGLLLPLWHVKQVTIGRPPKFVSLMLFIIAIIWRARLILGVGSPNASCLKTASLEWQNVQSSPMEEANIPITSKKVSTGNPFEHLDVPEHVVRHQRSLCRRQPGVLTHVRS